MAYLLQQLVLAVPLAAFYAALAFGYALAFGVTKRADLAYGALFAFSGQIYVLFVATGWNDLRLILPASLAFGAAVALTYAAGTGVFIARAVMAPLVKVSPNAVIVAALGLLIVLMETARLASGARDLWLPPVLSAPLVLARIGSLPVTITPMQLIDTAGYLLMIGIGQWILARTRLGRAWRAVTDDPLAAELCSVDARLVFVAAYAAAALMAAATAILSTTYYGNMDFGSGMMFGLKVLLIAAVGGYHDPWKSAAGAALLGLAETLWGAYAPFLWRDLAVFSGLVLVLVMSRREREIP